MKKKSLIFGILSMIFTAIIVVDILAMVVVGNIAAGGVDLGTLQTVLSWVLGASFGGMVVSFFVSYLIENHKK